MTSKPSLFGGSSPEEHVESCCNYFDVLFSSPDTLGAKIRSFIESILIDSVSVGVSRKVFTHVISRVKTLPNDLCLEYCGILTEALKLRLMSFEDQITELNQHMADLYEAKKDFGKAASNLSAIPLENSQKNYSKAFTTQMYLKIAHLYLEGRDSNQAEIFINRASLLITSTTEPDLQVCWVIEYDKLHLEFITHMQILL
jgi:COP9 signalosome complex subunit 4